MSKQDPIINILVYFLRLNLIVCSLKNIIVYLGTQGRYCTIIYLSPYMFELKYKFKII